MLTAPAVAAAAARASISASPCGPAGLSPLSTAAGRRPVRTAPGSAMISRGGTGPPASPKPEASPDDGCCPPKPRHPGRDRRGGRVRRCPGDRRRHQPEDRQRHRSGRRHGHVHLPDHVHAARRRAQGAGQASGPHTGDHGGGRQPLHGVLPAVGGPGADATRRTRSARSSRPCSAPLWRITIASIIAEVVSELVDTEVYSWFVDRVTTRHQWARVAVSNAVSVPARQRDLRRRRVRVAARSCATTRSPCRGTRCGRSSS